MGQTASRVLCRSPAAPKEPAWDKPNPIARFSCSMGVFTAEIYLDRVPITASNFIDLCQVRRNSRARCSSLLRAH